MPESRHETQSAVVWIVDDDVHVRQSLRRLLERRGFVAVALGPDEVPQTLATHVPNVAVVDRTMPFYDGTEIIRMIHAADGGASTKTIIYTGLDEPSLVDAARDCKATMVVSKGDGPLALIDAIVQLLS